MSPFSSLLAVFLLFVGSAGACAADGTRIERLHTEVATSEASTAHLQFAFLEAEYRYRYRPEATGRDFGKGNAKAVCPAQPEYDPHLFARRITVRPDASHRASFPFGISRPRGPPRLTTQRRII